MSRPEGPAPIDPDVILDAILKHDLNAVIVYDTEARIVHVSRSALELLHMSSEQLIGQRIGAIAANDIQKHVAETLAGHSSHGDGPFAMRPPRTSLWLRSRWAPLRGPDGRIVGGVVAMVDATREKRAEERAEKLALLDPVTNLPNRTTVSTMLSFALTGAREPTRDLALVWLNIDRFKDVNDALGTTTGDQILRAVGERLRAAVRTNDLVARVGGDDFLLVLPRCGSRANLERRIDRVQRVFDTPFVVGSESVLLTASSGVAVYPRAGDTAHELEEHAHTAMRGAKELGGGACKLYATDFVGDPNQRLRLMREMRDGLEQEHFVLYYQPQVDLRTMRVQAMEALARWQHPERGLLPPEEFIAFAEETAMIVPLGQYLLDQACRHHASWHRQLDEPPRLAVNISAREFQRDDVRDVVVATAEAAGVATSALELEITETAVLADPGHAAEVTACLRDAGVSIALDDFGTGYSSLMHLRELSIDRVKVDRSFVSSCLDDRSAAAILVAVVHLAHDLDLEVVAEGVETEDQLAFVHAVGCDAAQGYHLSRPLPAEECVDYLAKATHEPVATLEPAAGTRDRRSASTATRT